MLRPQGWQSLPVTELPLDDDAEEGGTGGESESEDDEATGDESEKEEPEPNENKCLLVDDIDGKHAEGVMGLGKSCKTTFGQNTPLEPISILTSIEPETPNCWKWHLVILGKTLGSGWYKTQLWIQKYF